MKQQKRKWREEDIKLAQERQKRIKEQKQEELVAREMEQAMLMQQLKEAEKLEQQQKIEEAIKELDERDKLMSTLTQVLGSNETPQKRKKILAEKQIPLQL